MWEVSTGHIVLKVSGGEDKVPFSAIAFSGRGRWMALGSGDHTAKLWDLKANRIVRSFGHPAPYRDLHRCSRSSHAAGAKWRRTVRAGRHRS